jgi:hypothetical protein
MIERIILLGDSYTFGHGCSDKNWYYDDVKKEFVGMKMTADFEKVPSENCWGSLIQKQFTNVQVVNIAKPGQSHMGMFRDFVNLIHDKKLNSTDLVMFNSSFPSRIEIAFHLNPEHAITWQVPNMLNQRNEPEEYALAKKLYVKYLYNDTISWNQALSAMLGVYGTCKLYGAQYVWSRPAWNGQYSEQMETVLRGLVDKFYPHIFQYDFSRMMDVRFNQQCYQPDKHCNDQGHRIYYETCILPLLETMDLAK